MKFYVPDKSFACYEVIDRHTIRAYKEKPVYSKNIEYFDIYLDANYLYGSTNTTWFWYNSESSHSNLPSCIDKNDLTTDYYYRNDIADILIIFVILAIFIIYLPYKIFSRFFGRWLKL